MKRVATIAILVILGSLTGAAVQADEKPSSGESSLILTNVFPPKDVFTLPIRTIVEILNSGAIASPAGQVRVQGVVQANPGRAVVLIRDRTGGIHIESSRTNDLKSGLWVDVVGSPIQRGAALALTDVTFRRIGVDAINQPVLKNSTASSAKVLTTVQQVRTLTPEDAALGHPVRVRCVVTYYDPGEWGTMFVQDSTAGIYVSTDGQTLDLDLGQWVDLEGTTAPGDFVPIISSPRFQLLGQAPMPSARRHTSKELFSGNKDSQWLQVDGIVHSVELKDGHLNMDLVEGGRHLEVMIPNFLNKPVPTHLVDAKVHVNGVCATIFNQKRQLVSVRLFVPSLEFVTSERTAPGDPFGLPIRSINSLSQFVAAEETDHRVRVQGTVTFCRPKEFFFVQDQNGGLLVKTEQAGTLAVGDRVDVVGFEETGNYTPVLTGSIFRKLGGGNLPEAREVTAEQALSANFKEEIFDAKLVSLQSHLLDLDVRSKEKTLVMQQGGTVFNAHFVGEALTRFCSSLRAGSLLKLTGVCSVQVDANRYPKSFQIYLRSPEDITVLKSPSFWTIGHTLALFAVMVSLALLTTGWITALRRRVRVQTELIQQRLEREKALEVRYRELFESNPHSMWVYDRETLAFLAVNDAAVQHYGYPRDEFLRMTLKNIRPVNDVEGLTQKLDAARDQSVEKGSRGKHRKRNGAIIDVEVASHRLIFAGREAQLVLATDITERLKAESALAESEHHLRSILESEPECVKLVAADGTILDMNRAGLKTVEAENLTQIVGQSVYQLVAPEYHAAFRSLNEAVFQGESRVAEFEIIGLRGTRRWMETHACPLRGADEKIFAQLAIARDITSRKRADAELEKLNKQLVEASRQAGMAEVATSVLHNVGNVLNSVNVSSSLVSENLKKSKAVNLSKVAALLREHALDLGAFLTNDPKGKQLPDYLAELAEHLAGERTSAIEELAHLQKNIEHIKEIVAMQQSYANISGVSETVQVSDLVEDALRMNGSALVRHDVEAIREFEAVPPITVEKHKVLQILVNLIRNAKYACDAAGGPDKRLTVRVTNGDNRVRIAIIDNGIGIPPENLTRIFNHGFTTRKDGHGFGLHSGALAAKELGGLLRVRSEGAGKGAMFILELPLERVRNNYG
jgi:PAS domain S-box-containing protein